MKIQKYIGYYINLNIIIINDLKYRYINEYDNNKNSIILLEKKKLYYQIYLIKNNNFNNIFTNKKILEIIKNFNLDNRLIFNNDIKLTEKKFKKINNLKNSNLKNLQNICNDYNICIYKYIDTRKLLKKNKN